VLKELRHGSDQEDNLYNPWLRSKMPLRTKGTLKTTRGRMAASSARRMSCER